MAFQWGLRIPGGAEEEKNLGVNLGSCKKWGNRFVCFGDLNDILFDHEKYGGNSRTNNQLFWGRQAMNISGLTNLAFACYKFTWTNGREEDNNVQCRLDRSLTSKSFINRFSSIIVTHLPYYGSDHAAIRTELEAITKGTQRKKGTFLDLKFGAGTLDVKVLLSDCGTTTLSRGTKNWKQCRGLMIFLRSTEGAQSFWK